MSQRNTTKSKGVLHVGAVCLVTVLLFPEIASSQEQENATSAVPSIPLGEDIDSRRGGGIRLERKSIQNPLNPPKTPATRAQSLPRLTQRYFRRNSKGVSYFSDD